MMVRAHRLTPETESSDLRDPGGARPDHDRDPDQGRGGNLPWVLERVKPYYGELIVVDGHSKDRTREIAEAAGARVVLDDGTGKGGALRVGARAATRDIVVFIDADGSHDPDDIPQMVAPILRGEADLVIGSRMRGGSDELHSKHPGVHPAASAARSSR